MPTCRQATPTPFLARGSGARNDDAPYCASVARFALSRTTHPLPARDSLAAGGME